MDRKFEGVTASTRIIHAAAASGRFELFRFLHSAGCSLESTSGIFELRPLHLAIVHDHFNIFCYLLAQKVKRNVIEQFDVFLMTDQTHALNHKALIFMPISILMFSNNRNVWK